MNCMALLSKPQIIQISLIMQKKLFGSGSARLGDFYLVIGSLLIVGRSVEVASMKSYGYAVIESPGH